MSLSGSISIDGVGKTIGAATILHDIALEIAGGTFVTLLGPSGCGKTTLLRLIAGFSDPSTGEIRIDGVPMRGVPPRDRPIGMVFQNLALFPHLDVAGNVAYGLRARGVGREETGRRVERFLELVGLPGFGARRISQISGGQKQRVALARSLVLEPSILLLDEPLSALDLQLRKQMQVELKKVQQAVRTTFVFVTHDQEEAAMLSDQVVVMQGGRICQTGTPREIYRAPGNHFVAQFIGDLNALSARVQRATPDAIEVELQGRRAVLSAAAWKGSPPTPGTPCILAFRPEDARLGTAPSEGWLQLPARTAGLVWTGATGRVTALVGDQPVTLHLMADALEAEAPEPGQDTLLALPLARAHLFPLS